MSKKKKHTFADTILEVKKVRLWNENYHTRHGHEWYEYCHTFCPGRQL